MAAKSKKKAKKKCCLKFIKKDKHCNKCPAAADTELKEQLLKKVVKKTK